MSAPETRKRETLQCGVNGIFILFEQIEIERFVRTTNTFVTTSCDGVERRIGQTFHLS